MPSPSPRDVTNTNVTELLTIEVKLAEFVTPAVTSA
jgi:hypothetical protein